jgi:hypothetical protein
MVMSRRDWQGEALCRNLAPTEADSLFFIGPGQSANRMRLFCSGCPVMQECRNYALVYNEWGGWGGSTEKEREDLDKGLVAYLREQERSTNGLESRNINDFIPPKMLIERQYQQSGQIDLESLLESLTHFADELLESIEEPPVELLMAQVHLSELPNAQQAS